MQRAREEPATTFVGIDPNHAGLVESSSKARARNGELANLHYLLGSYEELPGVLAGAANRLSVLFPWGSLLRAVAGGEPQKLRNLACLCAPGASIEVVTAIDSSADAGELARLGIAGFSPEAMANAWRHAGFERVELSVLPGDHPYRTTWWRKIRQRTERSPILLRARAP